MTHFNEFLSDEGWQLFWEEEDQFRKNQQILEILLRHPSLEDTDTEELSPDYWERFNVRSVEEDDNGFPSLPMSIWRDPTVYPIEEPYVARTLTCDEVLSPEEILVLMSFEENRFSPDF